MICSTMIVVNAFIKKCVNRNGCTDWHRRSQGMQRGHEPHKFLENIVILCFEGRFSKQNSDQKVLSRLAECDDIIRGAHFQS